MKDNPMEDRAKHDTIRALYKGVVEPQAWQRGLHALCLLSDSAQASLPVSYTHLRAHETS